MSPHEHYVAAEQLLASVQQYPEEHRVQVLAEAQIHATLATVKLGLPVVVSAPAEIIDKVKVVEGGFGGVLFIPDEMNTGGIDENAAQNLADALVESAKWAVENRP
jgi:hypothetical protein